jgi:hypothetical protein
MTDGKERVRLRAREGEDVEWTRRVAQRAGTLKDMMDDAPTEDGVYPLPTIAAAELAMLREMCEADSMPARLEQCSIPELFRLVEGASFLDAPGALNHAQRALATRLNSKRVDELRELLGATDDFDSVEDRVAALAEPAFSPEGHLSVATTGPPALQPLSGVAVTDDAKEAALGMVDLGTLAELKGVSRSWLALARRVLCSRLSRYEGQPLPTELAEITDLNIKVLVDAGRSWEAAAAGRMLPSLARLRWEGFTVNVAAVREADLAEEVTREDRRFGIIWPDEDDEDYEDAFVLRRTPSRNERPSFLRGRTKAALLSCIEGEGEPPLQLLLAAVACAGSGKVRGIPVQMMRNDSVSELNLAQPGFGGMLRRGIGVEGGMLLAHLVPVMGGLTALDLSNNDLRDEGVSAVCEAIQSNKDTKLSSLNFKHNGIGPGGANAVAAMVAATGGLTSIDLSGNQLCGLDEYAQGAYTAEGIIVIADALRVNGALTSVELSGNKLGNKGWGAIFAAICSNKDSKIMSMDASCENISPAGIQLIAEALRTSVTGGLTSIDLSGNLLCGIWTGPFGNQQGTYTAEGITAIADALRVNGALTVANLLGNKLDVKSAKMLAEVAKKKGISLCGIQHGQTIADFHNKRLKPPDAILLASDLSQAVVTGGLTSINLSGNQLCGIFTDGYGNQQGTYTAEYITAIADALRVNGALTVTNLLQNNLDVESAKMLAEVAKQKGISLCGIQRDQTTADFRNKSLKLPDVILLASDLSQAVVTGALTVTNLLGNQLDEESAKMLAEVAKQKGISLCGIRRDQTTANFRNKDLLPPDAILLASDLSQAIVTGGLTSLDLSKNALCGEVQSFGGVSGTFTAEGITAIADALRVNGALTKFS